MNGLQQNIIIDSAAPRFRLEAILGLLSTRGNWGQLEKITSPEELESVSDAVIRGILPYLYSAERKIVAADVTSNRF